jgi:hypothetical protein
MSVAFAIKLLDGSVGTGPEQSSQGRTFTDRSGFRFRGKMETKKMKGTPSVMIQIGQAIYLPR